MVESKQQLFMASPSQAQSEDHKLSQFMFHEFHYVHSLVKWNDLET